MVFGSIVSAVGLGLSAFQSLRAGDEDADRARDIAQREAKRTEEEVRKFRREHTRTLAAQRAGFANAGLNPDAGVALDVLADSLQEAELDIEFIEAGGELNVALAEDEARQARRRSRDFAIGSAFRGIGQLAEAELL